MRHTHRGSGMDRLGRTTCIMPRPTLASYASSGSLLLRSRVCSACGDEGTCSPPPPPSPPPLAHPTAVTESRSILCWLRNFAHVGDMKTVCIIFGVCSEIIRLKTSRLLASTTSPLETVAVHTGL